MFRTFLIIAFFCLSASAQIVSDIRTTPFTRSFLLATNAADGLARLGGNGSGQIVTNVDAVVNLVTGVDPRYTYGLVNVSGYYTRNDGGGGEFAPTNTASSTNIGTRIASPVTGWAWERVRNPSEIKARWFGAKGDGSTADATALQAALTALPTGGRFELQAGTYQLSTAVTSASANARLYGPGTLRESTILSNLLYVTGTGTRIDGLTIEGIETQSDFSGTAATNRAGIRVNANNVTVRDVSISGKSLGVSTGPGVQGFNASDSRISGFFTSSPSGVNNSAGIELNGVTNAQISGVMVTNMGQGILGNDRCKYVTVNGGNFSWNRDNGVYFSSGEFISIAGPQVNFNANAGVKARGYMIEVSGAMCFSNLQAVVLTPYNAFADAGSMDQAYTAYFGGPTNYGFFGGGLTMRGCKAWGTGRNVFEIDNTTPAVGTVVMARNSGIYDCTSYDGPIQDAYSVFRVVGNGMTIRNPQAYGVNAAAQIVVATGFSDLQLDGVTIEGGDLLDTNNVALNGINVGYYRNVDISGTRISMAAASARAVRLSGVTNATVTRIFSEDQIRTDDIESAYLNIYGNMRTPIVLGVAPVAGTSMIQGNIVPSATLETGVKYANNLGLDPTVYDGIHYDLTNRTLGFLTPASTSTNILATFRKDVVGSDAIVWLRNNDATANSSATLLLNSASSGGTLSAYYTGSSPARYGDAFVLKLNGDATAMTIDAPAGQDIHFYSGGTALKYKVNTVGAIFPTVSTNAVLFLDADYSLRGATNNGGLTLTNGVISVP